MANEADMADPYIQRAVDEGLARAKWAMDNPKLRPIILEMDGQRFGVCHHCESPIIPGHLFCPTDPIEPEHSCAVEWEHARKRKEDSGL
jgi:hypothetical protein